MRRILAVALGLGCTLAACVPSTDDLTPHGAAGFRLAPSPATRGEPFDTVDGYRITFDRVVALVSIQASVTDPDPENDEYGGGDWVLFDARSPEPVYCPGLPVGEVELSLYFSQLLVGDEDEAPAVDPGVEALLPRFRLRPDLRSAFFIDQDMISYGPSLLVELHAEGHGRRFEMSLTLEASVGASGITRVTVPENDVVTTPLRIEAEELLVARRSPRCSTFCGPYCLEDCTDFCLVSGVEADACAAGCERACAPEESADRPQPRFAALARADTNEDGVLTADELRAASPEDEGQDGDDSEYGGVNLATLLVERSNRLFGPPKP